MDPTKRLCHARMFVVFGPIYANAFSTVYVLDLAKTKQNIFVHTSVFKSLRFHLSTLETKRFQNDAFPLFIGVFGRFSVDDSLARTYQNVCVFKRKRISVNRALLLIGTAHFR